MLRVGLEGRSLPVVHGCGWDSGAARERSSALAAGAPATRRRRAVGGACACRARSNICAPLRENLVVVVVVVVVRTPTPNYLRQASPDRGKYFTVYF